MAVSYFCLHTEKKWANLFLPGARQSLPAHFNPVHFFPNNTLWWQQWFRRKTVNTLLCWWLTCYRSNKFNERKQNRQSPNSDVSYSRHPRHQGRLFLKVVKPEVIKRSTARVWPSPNKGGSVTNANKDQCAPSKSAFEACTRNVAQRADLSCFFDTRVVTPPQTTLMGLRLNLVLDSRAQLSVIANTAETSIQLNSVSKTPGHRGLGKRRRGCAATLLHSACLL